MAQRFIACDREQSFLMAPDVREWLPEDHFAWFVLEAVESMDLDAFYAVYRADGRARPAFDPAMMGWIQLVVATLDDEELRCNGRELYPDVVDGLEEEGGVPSRLLKTDRRKAEKEGTPWWMFAGSPSGRTTTRSWSRSMTLREKARGA